jgi:hypothetical protein
MEESKLTLGDYNVKCGPTNRQTVEKVFKKRALKQPGWVN